MHVLPLTNTMQGHIGLFKPFDLAELACNKSVGERTFVKGGYRNIKRLIALAWTIAANLILPT